ncbi:DinB family protein [Variovorax sp. PCZ-1]|uniref:DinB family protein n=1 Tax=Variovorax sp. PCZ-1 TaxID=2835533 RepID=UPI001BCD3D0E|nr:DinB family protein [Variovorax sp. PCZ-1]MBS7806217.1 DinB family protein [Variovorax sp. PCZ-1]
MSLLPTLFAQKTWANNELYNQLATVTAPEHADALHAAIRMLNHIYVVDRIFRAHLLGQAHSYKATNTDETPELGELQFAVAETDAWYEQYSTSITPEQLKENIAFKFTDGDAGRMTREEMLAHIITHGAYHRGNVGQILKSISVAAPRDLLTKFLHVREPGRRAA